MTSPPLVNSVPRSHALATRVLIVDDEAMNRAMLGGMVKRHGYRVIDTGDGSQVLDLIAEDVGLVLLDIVMPEMDGFEVLTRLRRIRSAVELPVIMVTASDDKDQVVKAFRLGANDFITKPVDVDIAMARIETQMQLRNSQAALRESEERYALAADGTNDGLWDWQVSSGEVYISPRCKSMLGLGPDDELASIDDLLMRIHTDDRKRVEWELNAHLQGLIPHFEAELRMQRDDESFPWVLCRGTAIRNENGVATRMAGSLTDITEGKVADALTGLPNRLLFRDRLQRAIDRRLGKFAVLYLDLDNFKLVNDSLGHEAGDQLLIAVAKRLENSVRKSECIIARLGGDEFTVLLEGIDSAQEAKQVAQRIIDAVSQPITIERGGREVFPTVSVGISYVEGRGRKVDDILREADTAMYNAKSNGKSGYRLFETEMHQQAKQRLDIESELRRALERNEIHLEYQPIVELGTGKLSCVEALVRWEHSRLGSVSPLKFIPIAEENGLIEPLGIAILKMACNQLARWKQARPACEDLSVNINLSSKQLSSNEIVDVIAEILDEENLQPRDLQVEITESALMENPHQGVRLLKSMRNLGVRIGIDDFGTGYSSLHCLHQLPLDYLKIDHSFVNEMTHSKDKVAIISTILALAHHMNLSVVAEGIETDEQRLQLLGMGAEFGQGFLFARPLTSRQLLSLVDEMEAR